MFPATWKNLQIKFDKLTSHDITFVGIIQTARASGLEKFPVPYVLTNCHNSLCAVGGTINEDDHMFGLTCAKKKYGGVYVPPSSGSNSSVCPRDACRRRKNDPRIRLPTPVTVHSGTMAMGEGGPELVKQLLSKTYDIAMPGSDRNLHDRRTAAGRRTAGYCTLPSSAQSLQMVT